MKKILFSRVEAAAALEVPLSTVDLMIRKRFLKTKRRGHRVLILRRDLEAAAQRADLTVNWSAIVTRIPASPRNR